MDQLAREKDPEKQGELTIQLAKLNDLLEGFAKIEAAKAQVAPIRERIRQEELALARQGQEIFSGYCQELVWPALERKAGIKRSFGDSSHQMRYEVIFEKYFQQLFAALKYDDAEKQALEIRAAESEGREWREIVTLPQPTHTDTGSSTTVRIIARRAPAFLTRIG
jgi:hypothetical protein